MGEQEKEGGIESGRGGKVRETDAVVSLPTLPLALKQFSYFSQQAKQCCPEVIPSQHLTSEDTHLSS